MRIYYYRGTRPTNKTEEHDRALMSPAPRGVVAAGGVLTRLHAPSAVKELLLVGGGADATHPDYMRIIYFFRGTRPTNKTEHARALRSVTVQGA